MIVNLEQIQIGVTNYVEKEIVPKATGIKKFGIYFMLPTIQKTIAGYMNKIDEIMPDLFDDNKNLKLDEFYSQAKSAVKKSGQFEFMGIIFNETDIDKLYTYIKGTSIA